MDAKIKTKISKSLKRHYAQEKRIDRIKTFAVWLTIITIAIIIQKAFFIAPHTAEAYFTHHYSLPVAEDKEMTTKEQVIAEIIKQARKYGVDENRALNIAWCESRYNTDAVNGQGSSATGLWQFTIGTWQDGVRWRGLDWTLEDRKDYKKSTDMTMWFVDREGWGRWECLKLI